jgi:hypothetical protein
MGEATAVAYIARATNSTSKRVTSLYVNDAPVGSYAVFGRSLVTSRGHVIYGQKLPNGKTYLYDPQIGRRLTQQQYDERYQRTGTYFFKSE